MAPAGRLLGSLALARNSGPVVSDGDATEVAAVGGAAEGVTVFDGSDMVKSRRSAWSKENNEGKRLRRRRRGREETNVEKGLFR